MILVQRAADLVDALQHERHVIEKAELGLHIVERAGQRAFSARPVVADDVDDERVVAQPHPFDSVHHLADPSVNVLEELGEHL